MARQRKHANNAARQRAYRQRKKGERELEMQRERERNAGAAEEMRAFVSISPPRGDLDDFKGADPK